MLEEIQQVATLAATIGGLALAVNGLNTWKREVMGKRDMELCQTLIETFYEAEDNMRQLRNPMAFNSESEARKRDEGESEDRRLYLDTVYVPIARWELQREFWVAFSAQRWRAKAILGEAVLDAFALVDKAAGQFKIAAAAKFRSASQNAPLPAHLQERYDNWVWEGSAEPDEIADRMKSAISKIEAICIPKVRPTSWNERLMTKIQSFRSRSKSFAQYLLTPFR